MPMKRQCPLIPGSRDATTSKCHAMPAGGNERAVGNPPKKHKKKEREGCFGVRPGLHGRLADELKGGGSRKKRRTVPVV